MKEMDKMNIPQIIEQMKNNKGHISGMLVLNGKTFHISNKEVVAFDNNANKHITFILTPKELE
jgi:hypothetical protein